jgi:hypothetical protein
MENQVNNWPSLDYTAWKDTYETLHLWTQIAGKIRLSKDPWANHSWYSTLYVTPRGLTTSAINDGEKDFSIDFDFIDHRLNIQTSIGQSINFPLQSESVASFYNRVMNSLKEMEIETHFNPHPNEVAKTTSFLDDIAPRVYNPDQARNCWQVLVRVNNVFKEFRSRFVGKCSPVHFFWGSFDLVVSRFSGRRAPEHPGHVPHLANKVVKEAYSHEVSSCGFWPGNEAYPNAAFYCYAYPEPTGYGETKVLPQAAFYHPTMREFILPYEKVQKSQNPSEMLLQFLQSTYEGAANLGAWDRSLLEVSPYRDLCQVKK